MSKPIQAIATLLIANRGEIARRIIRSAHDMGIRCVAVYVDVDAAAPFVQDADEAVRLDASYLDAAAILSAAKATGADAIHPGYGFLSENADFAGQVVRAGLAWVELSTGQFDIVDVRWDERFGGRVDLSFVPQLGWIVHQFSLRWPIVSHRQVQTRTSTDKTVLRRYWLVTRVREWEGRLLGIGLADAGR